MNSSKFDPKLFSELSRALGELETSSAKVAHIAQRCRYSIDGCREEAISPPPIPRFTPVASQSAHHTPSASSSDSVTPPQPPPPAHPAPTPAAPSPTSAPTPPIPAAPNPTAPPPASSLHASSLPYPPPPLPPTSAPPLPPVAQPEPTPPWWTDDKKVVKIIAIVGGLITAAGIAFLVALAIQSGLLGPTARVILTYALAAGLGATAVWSHRRKAPLVTVASLMVTALATANLTTLAIVKILRWINPEIGLLLVLIVTVISCYGARWAKSPATIAWSITLGNIFMASLILPTWQWGSTFAQALSSMSPLILMGSAIALWWKVTRGPVVASFVLAGNLSAGYLAISSAGDYGTLSTIYMIIFAALQLGPALLAEQAFAYRRTAQHDDLLAIAETHYGVSVISAAVTPLLFIITVDNIFLLLVAGAISVIYAALTLTHTGETLQYFGLTAVAAAILPWERLAFLGLDSDAAWAVIPVSLGALATAWMLVFPPTKDYEKVAKLAAGVWLTGAHVALAYLIAPAIVESIARSSTVTLPEAAALFFVLFADIGVVLAAARGIVPKAVALIGLALISLPFLHLLMLMGIAFTVAHMLLSITWVTLAGILVLSPRFQHIQYRLAAGLTIATLSVAKLILFDMANLDGFVRALAFIVCGLMLLTMAIFGAKQQRNTRGPERANDAQASNGVQANNGVQTSNDVETGNS